MSIFLLSRKLGGGHDGLDWGDGSTPVTLVLPANPTGPATLYHISGDPRATNRDALDVQIASVATNLARETVVNLPEGAIYLYVVDTDLADRDDPPPEPAASPAIAYSSTGASLTWTAVSGATHYVVYRSPDPFFDRNQVRETFTTTNTQWVDEGAVGGTRYYYRIAAANGWGAGMWTRVAAGGTNTAATLLDAPALEGLMARNAALIAAWPEVPGATGYRVGLAVASGGPYQWYDTGFATSWTLQGLENGRTYFVVVHAYGPMGRSPDSIERQGIPAAPGEPVVLAAWDGASLGYADTNQLPVSMPCVRHAFAVTASPVSLSPALTHSFDDYGYGPGTGTDGQSTHYDGKLTFAPTNDWSNFGAPGGGSLSNAVARELYLTFTMAAAVGQALRLDQLDTGFMYSFGQTNLRFALRYRVGTNIWREVTADGYTIRHGAAFCNDVSLDLSDEAALQEITEPVEFRFYLYATNAEARWHPASLVRCAGEDVLVHGTAEGIGPPPQPGELRSRAGERRIDLAWYPVPGAESYTVRWGREPGVALGGLTGLVQAACSVTNLGPAFYWFSVEANNALGGSPHRTMLLWGDEPPVLRTGRVPEGYPTLRISTNLAEAIVERITNLLESTVNWQAIPASFTTNQDSQLEFVLPHDHPHSFFRIKLTADDH